MLRLVIFPATWSEVADNPTFQEVRDLRQEYAVLGSQVDTERRLERSRRYPPSAFRFPLVVPCAARLYVLSRTRRDKNDKKTLAAPLFFRFSSYNFALLNLERNQLPCGALPNRLA